jgi:perosamine synthetase
VVAAVSASPRLLPPFVRLRRLPPVHSPIPTRALAAAAATVARGIDRRPELIALLQREFAADEVLLTGSGTQALQLALEVAFARAQSPRVAALPAFGCYDLASALIGAEARAALYDLDPATLSPDLASLERVLRSGVRVVVVAPLYGLPVAWDQLQALAQQYDAVLIEDAAQGHGARWRDRPLGSLGTISVLSFGRGKGWTGGSGGALLLRDGAADLPRGGHRMRGGARRQDLTALVRASAQWALARPALYGIPAALPWLHLGETRYHPPMIPAESGITTAAILVATREAAIEEAAVRKRRARELGRRVSRFARAVDPVADAEPGYLRLPVRVEAVLRDRVVARLKHLGVAHSYPTTLAELAELRRYLVPAHEPCAAAAALVRELITLPVHALLTDRELDEMPGGLSGEG